MWKDSDMFLGNIFLGNIFLCVRTKSMDPVTKFGLKAFHRSLLRHFEVQKMAASSSVLQVSGGHSSVASRSHINRKKMMGTGCSPYPPEMALVWEAEIQGNTDLLYLLSTSMKGYCTMHFSRAGVYITTAELQKGSQGCALAFKNRVRT